MKQISQKGFTLIEMITVLAIFSIISGVVLFNYGKFRSDTVLTNMAYEVALSLREAQVYGVSSRGVGSGATVDFTVPYGIFFKEGLNQYYLFADNDKDGKFTGDSCSDPQLKDTCITPYSLQQGVKITDFKALNPGNQCINADPTYIAAVFKRPNPEPILSFKDNPAISALQIQLTSANGVNRYVMIYSNGQISVTKDSVVCGSIK